MESVGTGLRVGAGVPVLGPGDGVRLKFLYPKGDVEILDATWLGVRNLDSVAGGDHPSWVVVRLGEREVWKPLSLLVQIEVLSKVALAEGNGGKGEQQSYYHG